VDGHTPVHLENDDKVVVKVSDNTVKFLVFQDPGYFYRNLEHYLEQNPSIGGQVSFDNGGTLYCTGIRNVRRIYVATSVNVPICSSCAVLTPTGYRCVECVRGQQRYSIPPSGGIIRSLSCSLYFVRMAAISSA